MTEAVAAYDAVFDVGQAGEWTLSQIISSALNSNVQPFIGRYSGGLDPQLIAVLSADPSANIQSGDLATLLAVSNILTAGYYMTGSSAILPLNQRANGGTFTSGAAMTFSSTRCFLHIGSIDSQQDGDATANVEYIPLYDGSTLPVVVNDDQTLAAQAFNAAYTLGPAKISTAALPGLVSCSVIPGLKLLRRRYEGNNYTTDIFIAEREPMIRWTFEDKAKMSVLGALHSSMAGSAVQYLRKRTPGGTVVANATTQHIALTLTAGLNVTDSISVSGTENGVFSVTAHGKALSVSTSSAITPGS